MSDSLDPLGIVGTVIDQKYRVDGVVGEGGFSVVYRAEHVIWKQPVALKCFNVLAGVPPQMREELLQGFIQEGKLMTSLSSRTAAIVQARDVGSLTLPQTGQVIPYMVLEWLEGRPLDRVVQVERTQNLPARSIFDVMALLEPVASALEVAHALNIAHRDIKPANLFVIGDPRSAGIFVKILDFGIAKVMAEHAQLQTSLAQTGREITAFTPNYGAPEQFSRSHGATGPWTVVFALALIMVELLRGGIPALQGDDYLQLAIASRDPSVRPTPRAFGVEVSDAVEAVFRRALAVAPRDRYKTAGELWAELHGAVFPGSPAWAPITVGGGTTPGYGGPMSGRPSYHTGPRYPSQTPGGQVTGPGYPSQITPPGAPGGTQITGPRIITPPTSGLASSTIPKKGKAGVVFAILAGVALLGGGAAALFMMGNGKVGASTQTAEPEAKPTVTASAAAPPAPTCPEGMATIAGSKFFMGSDEKDFPLWSPAHKVQVSAFCMDVNEVTTEAYAACVEKGECKRADRTPSYPKSDKQTDAQHEKNIAAYSELCNFGEEGKIKPGREKHPVNCVSWFLADEYCKVQKKRLPTEAEWEYAARGADGRKYPWGDQAGADGQHMNACGKECAAWEAEKGIEPKTPTMYDDDDGHFGTAPVGTFPKGVTKFGVNDMVGNVWEWTSDWYATYTPEEQTNPTGAKTGERKAIRGGGFNGGFPLWVNPAFRYHQVATASVHGIGFRCARTLE